VNVLSNLSYEEHSWMLIAHNVIFVQFCSLNEIISLGLKEVII